MEYSCHISIPIRGFLKWINFFVFHLIFSVFSDLLIFYFDCIKRYDKYNKCQIYIYNSFLKIGLSKHQQAKIGHKSNETQFENLTSIKAPELMSSKEQHIHHLLPSTNPKQLMVGVCNDFKRLLCELDIYCQ